MLHFGEVQDDGGEGDEDQIEESQGGDKVCGFAKVSTSKKHLKQNLERRELFSRILRAVATGQNESY